MNILMLILSVLFFLGVPFAVLALCRRFTWLAKLGPVLTLYIAGIIFGNIVHFDGLEKVQDLLSSAMVPLSIPLLLFGCRFHRGETRSQVLALVTAVAAVCAATVGGFLIFRSSVPEASKIGGMLTGVYSGGTMNLAALKTILGVDEGTFILLNSCDMIISFLYLTALMTFGIRLIRKWLPNETASSQDEPFAAENMPHDDAAKGIFTRAGLKDVAFLLGVTVLIIAVSAGLGAIAPEGWFMTVLILSLTTLGTAASFVPAVRARRYSDETGMYFIYVFSAVVASMADLSRFEVGSSLGTLGYLTFVVFGSLFVDLLLAKLLRVDADTVTISSVSFICSPPFVPMMSAAMKNRRVLVPGLSIGVVGYALGNYLGFLIFQLLELL
ncbi:MAG: DUF819 family protein [Bacteroidales bacterium]|nr:DUF819 family protein [Candidatus Cryptobacteroides onthequi]